MCLGIEAGFAAVLPGLGSGQWETAFSGSGVGWRRDLVAVEHLNCWWSRLAFQGLSEGSGSSCRDYSAVTALERLKKELSCSFVTTRDVGFAGIGFQSSGWTQESSELLSEESSATVVGQGKDSAAEV